MLMVIIWNKRLLRKLYLITFIFCGLIIFFKLLPTGEKLKKQFNRQFGSKRATLTYHKKEFYLDDQKFQIYGGSIHYFRVPIDMWKERLMLLKAAGLNTVETYSPWNLHEERKGMYNFDGNLNLRKFVLLAQELGLYVILRPGPYICAELEFGGLPSWLLSDPNMKVRSTYIGFMGPVEDYLQQLIREINDLQHSNGGPIIAFQLENEYGAFGNSQAYMKALRDIYLSSGIVEALFISDAADGFQNQKKLEDVFIGINSNKISQIERMAKGIAAVDNENPVFISELWTGWFDIWGAPKGISGLTKDDFSYLINEALKRGYSFNLYMFHGGTNFGFMNGGNNLTNDPVYITTSYDYDAPLSESGQPTEKYFILRKALLGHLSVNKNFKIVNVPEIANAVDYGIVRITETLEIKGLLDLVNNAVVTNELKTMEEMSINGNSGQSFGFIVYHAELNNPFENLTIKGRVKDRGLVLYNGRPLTGDWKQSVVMNNNEDIFLKLQNGLISSDSTKACLDIIVENLGRFNYARFQSETFNEQRRGLIGKVFTDKEQLQNWKIFPLDFKKTFLNKVSSSSNWRPRSNGSVSYPSMYRGTFTITEKPLNTFISMISWTKGVVFMNGFNLGRYWNVGPIQTLFIPKSFLRLGKNEIIIFELHAAGSTVSLQSKSVFLNSPIFM